MHEKFPSLHKGSYKANPGGGVLPYNGLMGTYGQPYTGDGFGLNVLNRVSKIAILS